VKGEEGRGKRKSEKQEQLSTNYANFHELKSERFAFGKRNGKQKGGESSPKPSELCKSFRCGADCAKDLADNALLCVES